MHNSIKGYSRHLLFLGNRLLVFGRCDTIAFNESTIEILPFKSTRMSYGFDRIFGVLMHQDNGVIESESVDV